MVSRKLYVLRECPVQDIPGTYKAGVGLYLVSTRMYSWCEIQIQYLVPAKIIAQSVYRVHHKTETLR